MAETKPIKATTGSLKEGSYLLIDNVPCTVKKCITAKTGGRGTARLNIDAISMIDGQKKVVLISTGEMVQVPLVGKKTAQVLSVQGESANLMDNETFETFDLQIPGELKDQLKEGGEVVYWIVMDQKIMKSVR
jgi:translation initiation factor 5A